MGKEPTKRQQEAGVDFISRLGAIAVLMQRVDGWGTHPAQTMEFMSKVAGFLTSLSEEGHELWEEEAKAARAAAQGMEDRLDRYRTSSCDPRNN